MLDVRLFTNPRFSAASASVTIAFFALFGFIFLITQYFQFVLGYSALEAGARLAPFAVATAVTSVAGARIAVAVGPRFVVAAGLLSMAVGFGWTATVGASTEYLVIAIQMVFLGGGLGLTTAPATASILNALPEAKAGVGSAVNDTTRQVGGTLGVAGSDRCSRRSTPTGLRTARSRATSRPTRLRPRRGRWVPRSRWLRRYPAPPERPWPNRRSPHSSTVSRSPA